MEVNGNLLIFILIVVFIFFSNSTNDGVTSQYEFNQLQNLKDQLKTEYEQFNNMTSTDNFRNITGLKLSYQDIVENPNISATYPLPNKSYDKWDSTEEFMLLPQEVISMIRDHVWKNENLVNYPRNITSTLHGKVDLVSNSHFQKIPMPVPRFYELPTDMSQTDPPLGEVYFNDTDWPKYGEVHNATFPTGNLDISITHINEVSINSYKKEKRKETMFNSQHDKWKLLHIIIDFHDNAEMEKHSIQSIAIYNTENGEILTMTLSAKFHSMFAFPHYMSLLKNDNSTFDEVSKRIRDYMDTSDYLNTFTIGDLQKLYSSATYKCEYMGFFQLKPWSSYSPEEIQMIDDELTWPLGRPINFSNFPPINITDGILYSPDCGVILKLNDVHGSPYGLQIMRIRTHLLFGILLFGAQIYLLLCQMNFTKTPSSINKVSFWSLAMMNLVDGFLAIIYFVSSAIFKELYLPLSIISFVCFMLADVLEIKYMISVQASQISDTRVRLLDLLRGTVQTERDNFVVVAPDDASITGRMYNKFVFISIMSVFLMLNALSWPKKLRILFEYTTLIILNSYWLPQIFRNAIKNNGPRSSRNLQNRNLTPNMAANGIPFLWKFIIGTTIIRIIPVVYAFTYSSNVFRHHKDVNFAIILLSWCLLQVLILYSQDILGSRWFLAKHSIPEGYSYHKSMDSGDLMEHGTNQYYCVDCAICMSDVPIYVEDIPETHKVNKNDYMVTPCSHIFHTECLENWMNYKLQCPVCRSLLPPL